MKYTLALAALIGVCSSIKLEDNRNATPLDNFHPAPKNASEAGTIDADNHRASNDIPEHCISAGHCGITSDK